MTEDEAKIVNCRKRKEFLDQIQHQNRLCLAMGVKAYNEFVKEYNGK